MDINKVICSLKEVRKLSDLLVRTNFSKTASSKKKSISGSTLLVHNSMLDKLTNAHINKHFEIKKILKTASYDKLQILMQIIQTRPLLSSKE